ncbi:MAG: PQQ-dependent sugar dehydrogenase [Vulcanimicrobiota bacterium]
MITHSNDNSGRLFVAELDGTIRVFQDNPDVTESKLFLDLSTKVVVGNERGLLGLAFHPQFASNGFFYVYYSAATSTSGQDHRTVVSRFQRSSNPDQADGSTETVLLTFDQPGSNHNGGCLVFGPDGNLYISSGDGGGGGDSADAQDDQSLLGKILRLKPDGTIPSDNPLVGSSGRGEIWARGFRNPWRMSFDPDTGRLWVGDVGESRLEEVDVVVRNGNYGWPLFEGELEFDNPAQLPFSNFDAPLLTYSREVGASITGGLVYRGSSLPELAGYYVYGDFISGRIWALESDGSEVVSNQLLASAEGNITFGTDRNGEIFIGTVGGSLFRLVR